MRVKATSLVETLVTSVVFLIVFGMAMDTAVNLRKLKVPDWAMIERDFNAYRKLAPEDEQTYVYEWGKIYTSCSGYHSVPGLADVQVTIILRDGRKTVYRYLYCEE